MGDRAIVIFRDKHTVSPSVYLHWDGSEVPSLLDELKGLMATRRGDASYACARFIGICHGKNSASPLSLGVFNTDEGRVCRGEWSAISHGDAGVVVVDCGDFSWMAYAGYLAKPSDQERQPDKEVGDNENPLCPSKEPCYVSARHELLKKTEMTKKPYQLAGTTCSRCQSEGPFLLDPADDFSVSDDGTLVFPEGVWGLDIDCDCPACGFRGRLEDFYVWVEVTGERRKEILTDFLKHFAHDEQTPNGDVVKRTTARNSVKAKSSRSH